MASPRRLHAFQLVPLQPPTKSALCGMHPQTKSISTARCSIQLTSSSSSVANKVGVTVAQFVNLEDEFENAGAQIIRQAANETNTSAGDGTTTATVLARAILNEAQRHIVAGVSPIELQRGIDATVSEICNNLTEMARPVTSIDDVKHIATISANNDSTIGDLIALAVDKVGQDGSITIEESRSMDTSIDVTEGFRFSAGY